MILQSVIEGISIGIGIAVIVLLPSRLFPAKPKDSLLANLKEMERRNKLLEDSNSINRINASCAVDMKRIIQIQHGWQEEQRKADKETKDMLISELLEALTFNTSHYGYTDEELNQLAASRTGTGEIMPDTAARVLAARRVIAKAKGKEMGK